MSNLISGLQFLYLLGAGGAILAVIGFQIIRNIFLSPLRQVPGPFLAKITPYWLIFTDLAGHRTTTLHHLHQKYGPTIRIGPNEISLSNQEFIKEIYSQQAVFPKAPVYDSMVVPPGGIFSFRNKKQHSQRRRLLSHAFSQANLQDTEPLIRDHVKIALECINSSLGVPIDIFTSFRRLSFDIVGELFLGTKFNGQNSAEPPEFLSDMDLHFLLCGIQQNFPLIYNVLSILPIPSVQYFLSARSRLMKYGQNALHAYIAQYGRDSGRRDLLTKVLTAKDGELPLTDKEIYTEISNLVFAGTDTTSTTLTYLFWTLAKYPEWQTRLRTELQATRSGGENSWSNGIPTYKDVMELPLLEAVINEALRLYPAAPSSMMRGTPLGGKVLNDIFVPEKTVVSMQCYTTHRNPLVFPNPDAFLPERWTNTHPDMKLNFMPFSAGSRACLGINLAWMELKVITAALVMNYGVRLAPGTTEQSMAMIDHFLAAPVAGKCELLFTEM